MENLSRLPALKSSRVADDQKPASSRSSANRRLLGCRRSLDSEVARTSCGRTGPDGRSLHLPPPRTNETARGDRGVRRGGLIRSSSNRRANATLGVKPGGTRWRIQRAGQLAKPKSCKISRNGPETKLLLRSDATAPRSPSDGWRSLGAFHESCARKRDAIGGKKEEPGRPRERAAMWATSRMKSVSLLIVLNAKRPQR